MNFSNYNIDFPLLLKAIDYYKALGYTAIEAPLLVDKDVSAITLPLDRKAKQHLEYSYVGSAEQSFYQLLKYKESTYTGSYIMLTPCVREEIPSESHLEVFLKLELISFTKNREEILEDVYEFYKTHVTGSVESVQTSEGYDININGIEVGSFGSRFIYGSWCSYGTGLALPRISYALNKINT